VQPDPDPREAYEEKLRALKQLIEASIARGGKNTDEDVDRALDEVEAELARGGY